MAVADPSLPTRTWKRPRMIPNAKLRIAIQAGDRAKEIAFPHVEGEETNAAADIDERLIRVGEQLERSRKNRVGAQFPAGIKPQPTFAKVRCDARAGLLVGGRGDAIFRCVARLH